ncbi:hypothetical protein M406DRAFT_101052 [Cryphonectria parasitica EP155]|uniref:Uncharacterized protein n=1 Tax=Cryphonectria parasitica (strain ATCC 38755 / EP155) TaxID=660469 RepID=A0A9P4YCG9_CRYP1|nr:uncharacterized protein M406DRAFT_101052 [Cryphonectria parasitica EP155]KAF3770947.1 hypothetical protein M406DRAFT_101052 [Cryphonectria parasitica EP155]
MTGRVPTSLAPLLKGMVARRIRTLLTSLLHSEFLKRKAWRSGVGLFSFTLRQSAFIFLPYGFIGCRGSP